MVTELQPEGRFRCRLCTGTAQNDSLWTHGTRLVDLLSRLALVRIQHGSQQSEGWGHPSLHSFTLGFHFLHVREPGLEAWQRFGNAFVQNVPTLPPSAPLLASLLHPSASLATHANTSSE